MAGDLSDIIDLTITIQASSISRAGFGTPLIGGYHSRYTDKLVHTYQKLADMTSDGFLTTDLEYIAGTKLKGAATSPKQFKVARLGAIGSAPLEVVNLTPATAVNTTYGFDLAITGSGVYQGISYTSSATANSAEILNGLTAAIAAATGYAGNIVAATATGKVTITSAAAGKHFAVRNVKNTFSNFTDTTADPGVAAALNNVLAEDSDWYALLLTYKGTNIQQAASAWVQTLRKMYITATADLEVLGASTTDIGSLEKAGSYNRTLLIFNSDYMAQPDAALAGVWLPYDPGSETVAFKPLVGVSPDNLTATQLTAARTKNVNYYITYAGVGIVMQGKVPDGKYADLIRFVDWLFANIQEDIYSLLISEPKVPFSRAGITQVEGVLHSVLQRGVNAGGLLPGFVVTVPALEDVAPADKAARNLSPVTFSADSAGAIQGVTINGSVAV